MPIRAEEQLDRAGVRAVNVAAFETALEANLVDALRDQAEPIVSLVAEDDGVIVGHIMFSPVSLSGHPALHIMGLAPMAVSPARQRKGIGSALVRAGLERCRRLGIGAVVVLGHPAYLPTFRVFAVRALWHQLRIRRAGRRVHGYGAARRLS